MTYPGELQIDACSCGHSRGRHRHAILTGACEECSCTGFAARESCEECGGSGLTGRYVDADVGVEEFDCPHCHGTGDARKTAVHG